MKKTNRNFKSIIAIAGIIFLLSCAKEMQEPRDRNYNQTATHSKVKNISDAVKNPKSYSGQTGTQDSTKTGVKP